MSPITESARARIMDYLRLHTTPNDPPVFERRHDSTFRRMVDDLIAAVRGEQESDRPF